MCRIQTFPHDLTICWRRFSSPRLSYSRLKRSAPLTQDLDGVAEIVLRRGEFEAQYYEQVAVA